MGILLATAGMNEVTLMKMRVKVPNTLRVRSAPSLDAELIDIMPNKTIVNVVDQQGDWSKIDSYGLKYDNGYIFSPCQPNSWVATKYLRKCWWIRFLKLNK